MKIITHQQTTFVINPLHADEVDTEFFNPDWWQQQQAIIGQSRGRGITWFVRFKDKELVLRHYYRGGLLGKCLHDRYVFTALNRTRAVAEYRLLLAMQAQNLPVPIPWAVRIERFGLFYRMDILLERIHGGRDLVQILRTQALTPAQWVDIGCTLQRFHQAGIYHADLNSHNILLDGDNKVWLIDFDKGEQRAAGTWQQANLQRLYRSLCKEATLHLQWHWQAADWAHLLAGYAGSNACMA